MVQKSFGLFWIWEKFEIRWLWIFGIPPQIWNISLKHLKLPKNHFKTNLFFLQLKYLKCAFEFGKKMKIWPPPPLLSKSPNFEFWTFWFLELTPPLLDFFHFLWPFFLMLPLPRNLRLIVCTVTNLTKIKDITPHKFQFFSCSIQFA